MNRIIACAFSFAGVTNLIKTVIKERPDEEQGVEKTDDKNETVETEDNETEEADYDEADGDDIDAENEENDEDEN